MLGPLGTDPTFPPGPQLVQELEQEQQSKQQLEGERRETESNWEAQITDILSWWVLARRCGPAQRGPRAQPMTLSSLPNQGE